MEQHDQTLRAELERPQEAVLKQQKSDCIFFNSEVVFGIRHLIGGESSGNRTNAKTKMSYKVIWVLLTTFVHVLCEILPNLSTVLAPLYQLLKKA